MVFFDIAVIFTVGVIDPADFAELHDAEFVFVQLGICGADFAHQVQDNFLFLCAEVKPGLLDQVVGLDYHVVAHLGQLAAVCFFFGRITHAIAPFLFAHAKSLIYCTTGREIGQLLFGNFFAQFLRVCYF